MTNSLQAAIDSKTKRSVVFPLSFSGAILLLMMIFGVVMLLGQGKLIELNPGMFYKVLTIHGTGMIGASALAGSCVLWYFLKQYVPLNIAVFRLNIFLFLVGVAMVLVGIFAYDFAGAWTFLYPLPALSGGMWGKQAAVLYLGGMLVIGTGFLILFLEAARAIIKQYGSLAAALGWPQLLGKEKGFGPPPTVVASTMVCIVDITALIAGAAILR